MRLNAFSLLLHKINHYVGLFLIYSPFLIFPLFIYLVISKKYSKTEWKSLAMALLIALPLALINGYAWSWVFIDIYFAEYSYLLRSVLTAIAVSIVCGAILWLVLKKRSSQFKNLVKYFLQSFTLLVGLYILLNFGWLSLRELLLKRDPAYLEMLEKFKARREVGDTVADGQND